MLTWRSSRIHPSLLCFLPSHFLPFIRFVRIYALLTYIDFVSYFYFHISLFSSFISECFVPFLRVAVSCDCGWTYQISEPATIKSYCRCLRWSYRWQVGHPHTRCGSRLATRHLVSSRAPTKIPSRFTFAREEATVSRWTK